ncbi:MAG: peptidoglycan DL-endopeptidase CwlO, partial [Actinomycetota bacterium]|nr:peptidoglycan DL-endopeptidase CwlO [Actinomycetota bacterium]
MNWKAPVPQRLSVVVRPASAALCILLAAAMAITPAGPAAAADPYPGPDGTTNQTLEQQLDAAAHAYVDAKGRLDASRTRQADLQQRLDVTQQRLTDLESQIGPIAAAAYRGNRVNMSALLLGSGSATALLHDAATVEYIARRDDREIRELSLARKAYADQKAAVDAEIVVGEQQTAEMEKRKNDAAKALGNPGPGTAVGTTLRASASPSPRNSDGSWPAESCSADDPTTSG